jgi:hypothetical protein
VGALAGAERAGASGKRRLRRDAFRPQLGQLSSETTEGSLLGAHRLAEGLSAADAVEESDTLELRVRCGEATFAGIDLALQALARRLRWRVPADESDAGPVVGAACRPR